MRITYNIINETAPPDVMAGGLLQYVRYGNALRERGIDVRIFTPLRPEHDQEHLKVEGATVIRLRDCGHESHIREREILLNKVIDLLKADGTRRHIIQTPGMTWAMALQLIRCRKYGIKSVIYPTSYPDAPKSILGRFKANLRKRIFYYPIDRFVMCSHRLEDFHAKSGWRRSRMAYVPNGVKLDRFSPIDRQARRDLRSKLDVKSDRKVVLYVGGFVPRKGVDVLIEAWEKVIRVHPDALLICVGSRGKRSTFRSSQDLEQLSKLLEATKKIIDLLEKSGNLRFTGDVQDVDNYYKIADVFVFPSRSEGLPNAVLEAMACALPCVVAPFQGVPLDNEEFGVRGKHFFEVPHSPELWAEKITDLLSEDAQINDMGNEARIWMETHQAFDQVMDKLAEVYRSLN